MSEAWEALSPPRPLAPSAHRSRSAAAEYAPVLSAGGESALHSAWTRAAGRQGVSPVSSFRLLFSTGFDCYSFTVLDCCSFTAGGESARGSGWLVAQVLGGVGGSSWSLGPRSEIPVGFLRFSNIHSGRGCVKSLRLCLHGTCAQTVSGRGGVFSSAGRKS